MPSQRKTAAPEIAHAAAANARSAGRVLSEALRTTLRSKFPSGAEGRREAARLTKPILDEIDPSDISHMTLRNIERQRLSVRKAISYKSKQVEMSESRNVGAVRPSWALDEKPTAYPFVDLLNVRRPKSDSHPMTFDGVTKTAPGVVKATRSTGSRGCYLLFSESHIVHMKDQKVLTSMEEFEQHARESMHPSNSRPVRNSWMHEELILEGPGVPARDLKFYSFYGEVALVVEARRDQGTPKYCYWLSDGTEVKSPYSGARGYFPGDGFTSDELSLVEQISQSIPHPFMRIDMLKSEDGLVFGEFTPRTGYFDQMSDEFDRYLGEAWVRAESRLLMDLLYGKEFDEYMTATNLFGEWQDPFR